MSCKVSWPMLTGRLDGERARPHDAIPQTLPEPDIADALQADVPAGVMEDAAPDQHPMRGEYVVRGAPAKPGFDCEPADKDHRDSEDRNQQSLLVLLVGNSGIPTPTSAQMRMNHNVAGTSVIQCGCRCSTTCSSSARSFSG